MGYSAKAASIRSKANNIVESGASIKGIAFDSVWSGGNYDNAALNLSTVVDSINSLTASLNTYASGLDLLQKYKNNREEIKSLNSQIASLRSSMNSSTDKSKASNIQGQISALNFKLRMLEEENLGLKSQIKSLLSAVSTSGSSMSSVDFKLNGSYVSYINDLVRKYSANNLNYLNNLVDKYSSGTLKSQSLYSVVDQQYVEDGIKYIKQNFTQREASVYSGMFIMSLAADNGVKIPYDMDPAVDNSPYISTKTLVDGADCEVVTDWVVDKGRQDGFTWKAKNNYTTVGEAVKSQDDWVNALPGDIFANYGHVGVILGNDPVNKTFICMEATMGDYHSVAVTTRTYDDLSSQRYQVQNMSSVYAGSNDQYTIKNYEQYVSKAI